MLMKCHGERKFIFVANTKAASTSIEDSTFADEVDIRLTNIRIGKHLSIGDIAERFDFVFEEFPLDSFLKFGVIRDPLDWVVSWFNFRSRPELRVPTHRSHHNYVGDIEFDQFWAASHDQPFLQPQAHKFVSSSDPAARVNYLIRFDRMRDDLSEVAGVLSRRPPKLAHRNVSRIKRISASSVNESLADEIRSRYSIDYKLLDSLPTLNASGLEHFRENGVRTASKISRVRAPLQNLVRNTPLEQSSRRIVNWVGTVRSDL
jgi:hypothetical protein